MMKRKQLIFILYFLAALSGRALAQYENMWAFCTTAGLDFNNGAPVAFTNSMYAQSTEAAASICDANGQLLFYTTGSYIWNQNDVWMPNGTNLTGLGGDRTSSTAQGALIAPMPGNPGKYYVFSMTSQEQAANRGRLYYSVVDMSLNGGLGDVIPGQKGVFVDSNFTESMIAISGTSCNIWVLVSSYDPVAFKAFNLTSQGLDPVPAVSGVGFGNPNMTTTIGSLAAATDGSRIVATIISSGLGHMASTLFDFDPNTGLASNPILLNGLGYKACFSPDNSKLYICNILGGDIFQFDLSSNNPAQMLASETALNMTGQVALTDLKRGPDGKIYFVNDQNPAMGVINFPNLAGLACDPVANAIPLSLGTTGGRGLPNVVPEIVRDTISSLQHIQAPCFANVHPPALQANDVSIGGSTYLWNTGLTGPHLVADLPGIYWVSYYSLCQYYTDTFIVAFSQGVLPDIGKQNSCEDQATGKAWATTYPGDTVAYQYEWLNAQNALISTSDSLLDVPAGTYRLHVTAGDCDTTISFYLPETAYHLDFIADSIICMGDAITFQNISDAEFTSFLWDFGDGQQTTLEQPVHAYPDPGSYSITLIGSGQICSDTVTKTIVVDSLLPGAFLLQPDSICTGRSITFLPQTDSSTISLHWEFGDGTGSTGPNERTLQHAYDEAGIMPVMMNARFRACPDTVFRDTVYVQAPPKIYLGPDTSLCLDGNPIILQNLEPINPSLQYHYLWNTGDTGSTLRVVHPGIYSLTMHNNPLDCSTTESVEIKKDCYIDMPNAFSPDGNGTNDYFFPRQLLSQKIIRFRMQVFNRWGQLIFETQNPAGRGWDGTFNGKPQPQGVYLYLIDANFVNGRKEAYQGNVTLIR